MCGLDKEDDNLNEENDERSTYKTLDSSFVVELDPSNPIH